MKHKSILHFTHKDLDGESCRILSRVAWRNSDNLTIIGCNDSGAETDKQWVLSKDLVDKSTLILFTDIVPSKSCLESIINEFPGQVRVIDHHKSNMWVNELLPDSVFPGDPNGPLPCGASLYYQYLLNTKDCVVDEVNELIIPFKKYFSPWQDSIDKIMVEDFVNIVRSWDVFEWSKTNYSTPKMLQTLFTLLGGEVFTENMVKKLMRGHRCREMFTKEELTFVRCAMEQEKKKMDRVNIDNVRLARVNGLSLAIMSPPGGFNFSDMASRFLGKYPNIDVFVGLFSDGNIGYRTRRDDINTAAIFAVPNGGGGHPKASGNPISDEKKATILETLFPGIELIGSYEEI